MLPILYHLSCHLCKWPLGFWTLNYLIAFHFQDYYEIVPCSRPDVDCLVDSLFEYSLLANVLLVMM